MYLPVPTQPDCLTAWREAVRHVDKQPGHEAHNVVLDISDPSGVDSSKEAAIAVIDEFLTTRAKPLETVANTIFPASLYYAHGAPAFFDVFEKKVLPKVRRGDRWSGYYFERMTAYPTPNGEPPNQLWDIVERLRNENVRALNKYELSLFDPARDVDNSPYGGQCLSFLSFKVIPGAQRKLVLTAMYRNHYYVEKLLGNLLGLGRLMQFVAREANLEVGALTVVSTHAVIDQPAQASRGTIAALLTSVDDAIATHRTSSEIISTLQ